LRTVVRLQQETCRGQAVAENLPRAARRPAQFLHPACRRYTRRPAHRRGVRHALCCRWCSFTRPFFEESVMLSWALAFFIIAIIAAVFGFTGIAAGAAEIAKILFVVFVVLFLVSLVAGLLRRP
jgi:uncharacterized membrane protein YtjA (UPF0391 family)